MSERNRIAAVPVLAASISDSLVPASQQQYVDATANNLRQLQVDFVPSQEDERVVAYTRQCEASRIRPNASIMLCLSQFSPENLLVLHLQRSYLGDSGLVTLAQCMTVSLPHLRALSLSNNGIANDGVAALCAALAEKCSEQRQGVCSPLVVLDLSMNPKITRVGGQSLLHAVSRARNHVACLSVANTRVTDYFESRISRYVQLRYEKMSELEQEQMYAWCAELGLIESDALSAQNGHLLLATTSNNGSRPCSSTLVTLPSSVGNETLRGPHFLEEEIVGVQGSPIPQRHPSTGGRGSSFDGAIVPRRAESVNPMFQANAPFDEIWYADDNIPTSPPIAAAGRNSSVMEIPRPNAPSGLETVLYSATPDFVHVFVEGEHPLTANSALSKRYTITSMPGRTVYGFTTPSVDEVEIFSFVDAFKPRNIELPMKFIFPGSIDYVAAVHSPDPMLGPAMPVLRKKRPLVLGLPAPPPLNLPVGATVSASSQLPAAFTSAQPSPMVDSTLDETQRSSMFWSFFQSANATGTPRDRTPQHNTPRSHLPLASEATTQPQPQATTAVAPTSPLPHSQNHSLSQLHSGLAVAEVEAHHSPRDSERGSPVSSSADSANGDDEHNRISVDTRSPVSLSPASLGHPTPVATKPNSFSSKAPIDPLQLLLGKVSDLCLSRALMNTKHASYPKPSPVPVGMSARNTAKPLHLLLSDPFWAPDRPTRNSQITDYCVLHKLKFDSVSKERRKPSGHDSREFFLQRIIRPSITDNLSAGAMNTRGNMLVTSNYDMTCKVWDLDTGKKLHTLRGHTGHLSDCAWNAPICDKVITSSFDKTLKVWGVHSGELLHTLRGHELEVVCVSVSPDGLECASGAMDDIAIIWDIERGVEKFTLAGHTAEVIALDFSPVGNLLASGSMDETVRVWNTTDGSCLRVFEGHTAEVGQVKFNCFGNIVLSGSIDGSCKLWDITSGRHKTLRGHTHEVVDCDFSPDGWICASASDDGTVRIWDVLSGGCITLIVGHERGVCRLAFTATGKELITGSLDTTAKVWNVETGECKQTLRGHKGLVLVTYNAASEKILTLSRDNTCRIWKLESELDTLTHSLALAVSQFPTMYSDILYSQALPAHLVNHLHRVYRKVFRTEEGNTLAAPSSPLPQMKSPEQMEDETVDGDDSVNQGNGNQPALENNVNDA